MKTAVPAAFAVACTIPTRRVPWSARAHSAQPASAVGTAATTPKPDEAGGGSPRAVIGDQIEELRHEPSTEGHVGEDDVQRDASCVPVEHTAEPLVGNGSAGQRLGGAYNRVKPLRMLYSAKQLEKDARHSLLRGLLSGHVHVQWVVCAHGHSSDSCGRQKFRSAGRRVTPTSLKYYDHSVLSLQI